MSNTPLKAVGLISGGLDSFLATRIVRDLGIQINGIFFCLPWGCTKLHYARAVAAAADVPLKIEQLGEDFMEMIRHPRFGRGAGINPCVDCHAFMIKKAAQFMRELNADFVFTGEVLGQRPMSQLKKSLFLIEQNSGLEGRLLRPLSAQLLPPTRMEEQGLIDRKKLLGICGRSRKQQLELARQWNAKGFSPPAGGCLLTDRNFSRRVLDLFQHGYRNHNDLKILQWGRHFRLDAQHKAILGRDEIENQRLIDHVTQGDHILDFTDRNGPTLILQGLQPSPALLSQAAGLIQWFSRYRDQNPKDVIAIQTGVQSHTQSIIPTTLVHETVEGWRI